VSQSPQSPQTRRSPRYLRFLGTGALVGVLVAAVLTVRRAGQVEQPWVLFLYLAIVLGVVGGILGGLVAVVLDARRARRP
jgi:uncharacterized membrane protein AbrB (regulator of aidB expression)